MLLVVQTLVTVLIQGFYAVTKGPDQRLYGLHVDWHAGIGNVILGGRLGGSDRSWWWSAPQEVHAKLLEEIDDEHIPVEYGGKDARHLYESDQEVAIWRLPDKKGGRS